MSADRPDEAGRASRSRIPRKRAIAWALWLAVTVIAAVGLRHYRIDNDLADWMPRLDVVGPYRSYVVVGFERDDFDVGPVAARLRSLPTVAFCIDPMTANAFGEATGLTPADFVIGTDGRYVGVFCFRREKASDGEFVAEARSALCELDSPDAARFALGGPAVFHTALNEASQRRLPAIMLMIVLVGALLLWWVTGRLTTAAVAVAGITMSQIVLVGVLSWRRVPIDMSLSMVPPMMMALGFSYAAHRALRRGVLRTLGLCLLTTALGIGSFAATDLPPIRAFALYGVLGLGLAWLAVVILVPASECSERSRAAARPWLASGLRCCLAVIEPRPRWVVAFAVTATFASLVAVRSLRVETDPLNYFPRGSRIVRDFSTLDDRLTGMLPFQVTVTGRADPRPVLMATPGVRKVIDVSAFVKSNSRVYWCLADNDALPSLADHQATWHAWAEANGADITWRGVAAQLHEVGVILRRIATAALLGMTLVAAMLAGFLARSVRLAIFSAWVNLLPVGGVVLVAALSHWALGLPALMIGAIAVGVAIDDTLHIIAGLKAGSSIAQVMVECWRPCTGSSLVAAACLALFAMSPFAPTAQFGLLTSAAVLTALVGDMLVLPALSVVSICSRRKLRRR